MDTATGILAAAWADRCLVNPISQFSLGKGSRPIRDYAGLLGLIRPYWEDMAPEQQL